MNHAEVTLIPLTEDDREDFIRDNQWAFKHGALIEFGERDDNLNDEGEIISRSTIEGCIDSPKSEAYRITMDGKRVGGIVVTIDPDSGHNVLDLLFVKPEEHGKGIGYDAWMAMEALHPETRTWETCTPYFDKRNIHFYLNKCEFQIVEFWNSKNPDPHSADEDGGGPDEMFRFIKRMV